MEDKKTILMLFKVFGKKEYAKQFLNGEMYFNPVTSFARSMHKERKDRYEGSNYIANKGTTEILLEIPDQDKPIIINQDSGLIDLHISLDNNQFKKICSLYAVTSSETFNKQSFKVDKRMLEFGNYVVQIINSQKLLKRFRSKLNEKQHKYRYSLVDYVDINEYSGKWSTFNKPRNYSHQNEFRFMFIGSHRDPEKVALGDMSDIAVLKSMEAFLDTDIQILSKRNGEALEDFTLRELLF